MSAQIPTILGALILGLPSIALAWIAFRKERQLFWFALALIVVGTGYLATTGALMGIAKVVLGQKI